MQKSIVKSVIFCQRWGAPGGVLVFCMCLRRERCIVRASLVRKGGGAGNGASFAEERLVAFLHT